MTAPDNYFDINSEPSQFEGQFQPDPSEQSVPVIDGQEDEISTVRDSVLNEPAFTGRLKQAELGVWLSQKRNQCTFWGNSMVTLAAALIAGPFAVMGAFMAGRQTWFQILYLIIFAPVIEELLKQSGMIYLLEKKPYRIFSTWQFIVAAVISAGVFAAIENLLYIYFYSNGRTFHSFSDFCCFRWAVCTSLHMMCSVIASLGLVRVWKKQLADGRAADLSFGFHYFIAAMAVHGIYNLSAAMINPQY
jgi:RsiW-degrading membrane proteinase PrsW (M82 family)